MKIDPTPFPLGIIIYCLFLAAALGFFAKTMWERFGVLRKSQKDARFDRWVDRAKHLMLYAIGQKRIIAGDVGPGIIHAFIFWGFLAVGLNTLHHVCKGFIAGFHLPLLGPDAVLGALYVVFRDVFEVLVLIMVIDGFILGRKVNRLADAKFPDNTESGWKLGFYAASRASQLRRMRAPRPQVDRGTKVT